MPRRLGTPSHENGVGRVYLGHCPVLGVRPACVWCAKPENELGPDLGPTVTSDPVLSPLPGGEHAEQSARRHEVAPWPGPFRPGARPPWRSFTTAVPGWTSTSTPSSPASAVSAPTATSRTTSGPSAR